MGEIRSLTMLRGISALWVVCYHGNLWFAVKPLPHAIFDYGFIGVDVFFVLSGYVMATAYRDLKSSDLLKFFRKRLLRLYPLHLSVMTLLAVQAILNFGPGLNDELTWTSFLSVLFLIGPVSGVETWNAAAWSLGVELTCYAAFPFLIPRLRCIGMTVSIVAAILIIPALVAVIISETHVTSGRIYTETCGLGVYVRGMLGFLSGMLIRNVIDPNWISGWRWLDGSVLRPFHRLGEISLSVYLLGAPILGAFSDRDAFGSVLGAQTASTLTFVFAVCGIVSASTITYRYIEQPGRNFAVGQRPFQPIDLATRSSGRMT